MANISDQFNADLTAHGVDLMRYAASVRKRVLGRLGMLRDDLANKLQALEGTQNDNDLQKRRRLQSLLVQADKTIETAYKDVSAVKITEMKSLAELESKYVRSMFKNVVGVDLASNVLTPAMLSTIASNTLVYGAPAKDWWMRQASATRLAFADQMRMGYLQGETVNELVQRLRGTATGKRNLFDWKGKTYTYVEFQGGLMDIATRQAEALVRTSVQSLANATRLETYKENGDVIKGVQASATLDNRTTLLCMGRDGHAWDLEGNPINGTKEKWPGPPPWHFNCRSTLIPITYSWQELAERAKGNKSLGKIVDKMGAANPATRASMDGQVAADLKYEDWLKTKPEAFQRDVLGAARYMLWTKGQLTLAKMLDQTGNPLTLAQIANKLLEQGKVSAAAVANDATDVPTIVSEGQDTRTTIDRARGVLKGNEWQGRVEDKAAREAYIKNYSNADESKWYATVKTMAKDMSKSEADIVASVDAYVGTSYRPMNDFLRGTRADIDPLFQNYIETMREATLHAPPIVEDAVVYRGINGKIPGLVQKAVGEVVDMQGFLSTSLSQRIAKDFMDFDLVSASGEFPGQLLEIVTDKGAKGVLAGMNLLEREFIFDHNSRFRVLGVREQIVRGSTNHGMMNVKVEVVQLHYIGQGK